MTATTKPAILSAAEIERIRRNTSTGLLGEDTRAPLAHIDALTAGAAGPDAGRRLYYELNPRAHRDAWEASDPDVREQHDKAAASLRAAGRSEGERLAASMADKARCAVDHVGAVAGDALTAKDAEIARLTAELAKRQHQIEDLARAGIKQARAEGAREERAAVDLYLLTEYQKTRYEGPAAEALSDALDWLRARGEGSPT